MVRAKRIGDATLYLGDVLEVLPQISGVDAFIVDPPYSSGGQFRSDRAARPSRKYIQTNTSHAGTFRGEFAGDNKDQRSFVAWSMLWTGYMLRASNPGATLTMFTDWRQLPVMSDAIQGGGWVWRNIVTWWKPGIRMQRGRFSGSAEYLLYASNGVPIAGVRSPQNVLVHKPVSGGDKVHIAEKPATLLADIVGVTPEGATVADPFMGSGTTGLACMAEGRKFIGVEIDPLHFAVASARIEAAYRARDLKAGCSGGPPGGAQAAA